MLYTIKYIGKQVLKYKKIPEASELIQGDAYILNTTFTRLFETSSDSTQTLSPVPHIGRMSA